MTAGFCKICRLQIAPGEGTLLKAFGKPLLVVHTNPCARSVQSGVYVATTAAMSGARALMKARAPNMLQLIDRTVAVTRQIKEGSGP